MNKPILIAGAETFSMVDYPGQMAAVVFMQGCPWHCPFCHNADLQKIGAQNGFEWSKFMDFLIERKGRLDAVVFSGGEPLVQDSLLDAVHDVQALGGYKIGLHTGGFRPALFKQVLPLLDWVGFDIKAPLEPARYQQIIGINHLDKVLESLRLLLDSDIAFECRTTCDPRFLSLDDISQIGDELSALGVKEYYLQKYRPVASDTATTDSACDSFFEYPPLLEKLRSQFKTFDTRR